MWSAQMVLSFLLALLREKQWSVAFVRHCECRINGASVNEAEQDDCFSKLKA